MAAGARWLRAGSLALAALASGLAVQACDGGPSEPGTAVTHALTVVLDGLGAGTVTSDPAGIACATGEAGPTGTCAAEFDEGTDVALTATPAAGHALAGWSGDGTGATTRAVAMTGARTVTASFDDPDLAREEVGTGGGTVASRDGAVSLEFPAGALGALTAITIERLDPADLPAAFQGRLDSIASAYELGPDGLTFDEPVVVTLTPVEVPVGDTVTLAIRPLTTLGEAGIEDLDSLSVSGTVGGAAVVTGRLSHFSPIVVDNEEVEWEFTGVVEGQQPVGATWTVMVKSRVPDTWDPSSEYGAWGTVVAVVSQEPTGEGGYAVTFRCAVPGVGSYGIEGLVTDLWTEKSRYVDMEASIECLGATLTVTTSGEGGGTVTSDPAGIVCGSGGDDCVAHYPPGTEPALTAAPDPGSTFLGWSGGGYDLPGGAGTRGVILDEGDATVDAAFGLAPEVTLTVTLAGDADLDVTSEPAGISLQRRDGVVTGTAIAPFPQGSEVDLTATQPDGSAADRITGPGTTQPDGTHRVTVDEDTEVEVQASKPPATPTTRFVYHNDEPVRLEGFDILLALFGLYPEGYDPDPASPGMIAADALVAPPAAGPACPDALMAGTEVSVLVNTCTGDVIREIEFAGSTSYDALYFPRPAGATGTHGLLMTGAGYVDCAVDEAAAIECVRQMFGNYTDMTRIPGDPSHGAVVTDKGSKIIQFYRYDPAEGYFRFLPGYAGVNATPPGLESAVAGVPPAGDMLPPEELLAVGSTFDEGVLYHIDMQAEDPEEYPWGEQAGVLGGDDPRRIRCDLEAGVCAVSDFANSLVTVVLWSGTGMPTIAGVTDPGAIGDGPVGLDVFGHRIVVAGFNDDTYSIIEVDEAGDIVSTTTEPLPAGCTQPGHAAFLRDGSNTILVTCWGNGAFARIPGAF